MQISCSKCHKEILPEKSIEIDVYNKGEKLYFCSSCLKEALSTLNMKRNKTKEEIELLKQLRGFFKHEQN